MQTINACCVVYPNGTTQWFDVTGKPETYLRDLIQQWRTDHPEYDGKTSTGAVVITMPLEDYNRIPADPTMPSTYDHNVEMPENRLEQIEHGLKRERGNGQFEGNALLSKD